MVRTPGFHPGNRGFESRRDHHGFEFWRHSLNGCFLLHDALWRDENFWSKKRFYKKVRKNVRKVLTNYIKCDNILSIVGVRTEEVATATRKRREGE